MNKKYQIFISSTYIDLKDEREKVKELILKLHHIPAGMEAFNAACTDQWAIIEKMIDECDYYILIIGGRYGSLISKGKDKGMSYTEKEYRYAKKSGLPILAFIASDDAPIPQKYIESDPEKREKLEKLKEELKKSIHIGFWDHKEQIPEMVSTALQDLFKSTKRPGWVRIDDIGEKQDEIESWKKKYSDLEEKYKELKSKVDVTKSRTPNLDIKINNLDIIEIPFWERDMKGIELEFLPLEYEDIPDGTGISEKEIDEYNKSLPSKEKIEEYKNKVLFYERANEHATKIDIKINNNGTKKANDVYIELCFPDEIRVFEKAMIEDIEYPNFPMKVENPINKYYREKNNIMIPRIMQNYDCFKYNASPKRISNLISSVRNISSPNRYFINDDNSISIRMDNLMHEYEWDINDEYIIVPRKKGEFEIECHIICEEYSREQIQIIPVIVK